MLKGALENEMSRQAILGMAGLALYYAADNYDAFPKSDNVKIVAETMVENTVRKVIEPNLAFLFEQIEELVKAADKLPDFTRAEDKGRQLETEDEPASFEFDKHEESAKEHVAAFVGK